MASKDTSSNGQPTSPDPEAEQGPEPFRLRSEVDVSFGASAPSAAQIRALLSPMAVEKTDEPGTYTVHDGDTTVTTNLYDNSCTCSAGSKLEDYKCRHYWHIEYRKKSGTLSNPPDRPDPVEERAARAAVVADQVREQQKVTAGEGEVVMECCECEQERAIEIRDGMDESMLVCESCSPVHPSIVYLQFPKSEDDEGSLVLVRDVVEGEQAQSYYPGDESVFSLADMFSKVEGVEKSDSVVRVSEPIVEEPYVVFEEESRAVPQGALRDVYDPSEEE